MSLSDLVATSRAVTESSGRLDKIGQLSAFLKRTRADEIEIGVSFLSGTTRQGRIGIGGAVIRACRQEPPSSESTLQLSDVDEAFGRIAGLSGSGSSAARAGVLRQLLGQATAVEQDFLVRLLFGELRQGALEGVLVEAVARAAAIAPALVRRAAMMAGGLPQVARAALTSGALGARRVCRHAAPPVQPMLADSAADVNEALSVLGEAALEYKLDGARIQVHKADDEVRVFSRALRDVTVAVPEVVEVVRRMPARSVILDGEAIALRAGRRSATVSNHDAAVRTKARRRSTAAGVAHRALFLRLPVPRRGAAHRRAVIAPRRGARSAGRDRGGGAQNRHVASGPRRRFRGPGRWRRGTKASWPKPSAPDTPPADAARHGSRSNRRVRSTWSCSP